MKIVLNQLEILISEILNRHQHICNIPAKPVDSLQHRSTRTQEYVDIKRKLETSKNSSVKSKTTGKESTNKSITIDLDLHNQDDEEEKPSKQDKIERNLGERRSDRLQAKERKEEIIKVNNMANVKNLQEIFDQEEDDYFMDNLEDEDFQEEDDLKENSKEEMEEEEEVNEISEIEEDLDTQKYIPEVPNVSADEEMVPCSQDSPIKTNNNNNLYQNLQELKEGVSTLDTKNVEQNLKIQNLCDALSFLYCITNGVMKNVILGMVSSQGRIKKNKKKLAKKGHMEKVPFFL